MDNVLYQQLKQYEQVLNHWDQNKIFAGGDLGGLESISLKLGYAPTNFGCGTCKGDLLTRMYNALKQHEKENNNSNSTPGGDSHPH